MTIVKNRLEECLATETARETRLDSFSTLGTDVVEGPSEREEAVLPSAVPEREAPGSSSVNAKTANLSFDVNVDDLQVTWSSYAQVVCCVNSYPNGLTVSLHSAVNDKGKSKTKEENAAVDAKKRFMPNQFHLRFRDTRDYQPAQGKFFLYKKGVLTSLERHLSMLNQRGLLASTVLYFGTTSDPFLGFHKKFDVTTGCLELFENYRPSKLVIQTRSPMVIAALPAMKLLGDQAVVAMPVESHMEKSIARYTPGNPKISERLVAAQGLRRQGVTVNLLVSPVLPYGDPYRDAWDFAELLDRHADYISFGCLADGSEASEKQLKELPVAQKLATDEQYPWLRPHAYRFLYNALKKIAPQKLRLPVSGPQKSNQLTLFAA